MCAKLQSSTAATSIKRLSLLIAIFFYLGMISSVAQAVTIDFDDLEFIYGHPEDILEDNSLSDEYLEQGLRINNGILMSYAFFEEESGMNNPLSPPNFLLGGAKLRFDFIGALPTFVSMYVDALSREPLTIEAHDARGSITRKQTAVGGPLEDDRHTPNQYVSFSSPLGFASITVENYYGRRVDPIVDNLTYEYASVPEPSSLALVFIGLLGLAWRKSGALSKNVY